MNVLSLFDGISCGQIALNRCGIKYDKYFASEIDKYAISVTKYNYPGTIELGDIKKIKPSDLPKIDLVVGGSPCQGFSVAGKKLNFEDPRSKLFFEFIRLKNELNPKWFLLENVVMKKKYISIISDHIGINPVMINSALVSAQNRKRLYWTNINAQKDILRMDISGIKQPDNKKIILADIIKKGFTDRDKSYPIDAHYQNTSLTSLNRYYRKASRQVIFDKPVVCAIAKIKGHESISGNHQPKIKTDILKWRKLSPLECERLQTIPDNYTKYGIGNKKISNSQRYKMLGNGFTVDVIVHILKGLKRR